MISLKTAKAAVTQYNLRRLPRINKLHEWTTNDTRAFKGNLITFIIGNAYIFNRFFCTGNTHFRLLQGHIIIQIISSRHFIKFLAFEFSHSFYVLYVFPHYRIKRCNLEEQQYFARNIQIKWHKKILDLT